MIGISTDAYTFDVRRGDTLQLVTPEETIQGRVVDVPLDHGWYRIVPVEAGDRVLAVRLYRDREDRAESPVVSVRVLRRRDRRRLYVYKGRL